MQGPSIIPLILSANRKATCSIFIVDFGMSRPRFEPTIYRLIYRGLLKHIYIGNKQSFTLIRALAKMYTTTFASIHAIPIPKHQQTHPHVHIHMHARTHTNTWARIIATNQYVPFFRNKFLTPNQKFATECSDVPENIRFVAIHTNETRITTEGIRKIPRNAHWQTLLSADFVSVCVTQQTYKRAFWALFQSNKTKPKITTNGAVRI